MDNKEALCVSGAQFAGDEVAVVGVGTGVTDLFSLGFILIKF